jgi:uncharacterized membrane protein (UPF0127 family)
MPWLITNATRQRPLADRAEQADTFLSRFVGLMGRRHLAFGEGLHIRPCNGIHTFFMRIPIDAAFLDAEGVIVKQFHALPPWRTTAIYRRARSVLELPAGTLAASGTQEGDLLSFQHLP